MANRSTIINAALAMALALSCGGPFAQAAPALLPAKVLDLTNWALQLPRLAPGTNKTQPQVVFPLTNFTDKDYFYTQTTPNGTAVVFRVDAGGFEADTPTSLYPRTELREVQAPSGKSAEWKLADKVTRTLTLRGAVTRFTPVNPQVVIMQIHAKSGQRPAVPLLIKVVANQTGLATPTTNNNYVAVNVNGRRAGRLTSRYRLGDVYTLRVEAGGDLIKVYWNDLVTPKFTFNVSGTNTDNYFKAGAYLQTNTTLGEKPASFAEVHVYNLTLTATPGVNGTATAGIVRVTSSGGFLRRRQMLSGSSQAAMVTRSGGHL